MHHGVIWSFRYYMVRQTAAGGVGYFAIQLAKLVDPNTYKMHEVGKAHNWLENGKPIGKYVWNGI